MCITLQSYSDCMCVEEDDRGDRLDSPYCCETGNGRDACEEVRLMSERPVQNIQYTM